MTRETAIQLINTYLDHIAVNLDLDTLAEEKADLPLAGKLGINQYQVFLCSFKQDKISQLAFLFVYINEPDRIIAHKLFNLVSDLSWYFTKQEMEILPSVIPVLIYNGDQDFEPQSLKQIYTSPERAPQFYFEYINLKNHYNTLIGQ